MVSGRRPSKTRGFLRFSKRPRNPLRTLGWSTFENSWFFAILKTRGFLRFSKRPRDPLRTLGWSTFENSWFFCDFQFARATLCGLWAGRPLKTRGFFRFSNRPRDPLRTLGWSTFENSWFFPIFSSPVRSSAELRVAKSLSSWRGARFLEAVNP